jgi:hypothetical protein
MKALIDLVFALFSLFVLLVTPKERVKEIVDSVMGDNTEKETVRTISVTTEKIDETYFAWAEGQFMGQADTPADLAKTLYKKLGKHHLVFPPMKITTTKDKEVSSYGIKKTIH